MEKKTKLSKYLNIVKGILAFLLVGFVLSKVKIGEIFALQERISFFWLLIVLILFFLITLLKAMQYYVLIGRQVNYPAVLNIVVTQNAISNFIATSIGILSYLTMLHVEQGVKVRRASFVFLLTKAGDLISLWLFLLVSSFFVWGKIESLHSVVVVLLALIFVLILLFFCSIILRERFVFGLRKICDKLNLGKISFVDNSLNMLQSLAEQEQSAVFRMVGLSIAYSIFYLFLTLLWAYATLQTFELKISIDGIVFVNLLTQLISYLPIQIFGGLGVNEISMLYLYGYFGLPQAEIATVLVAARVLFYLMNLLALLYLPIYTFFIDRSIKNVN
jgi:uncharacterized protein (TIRG00374 family)